MTRTACAANAILCSGHLETRHGDRHDKRPGHKATVTDLGQANRDDRPALHIGMFFLAVHALHAWHAKRLVRIPFCNTLHHVFVPCDMVHVSLHAATTQCIAATAQNTSMSMSHISHEVSLP